MSSYTIHIANNTIYTPEIREIQLTDSEWWPLLGFRDRQPIRSEGVAQGSLSPAGSSRTYSAVLDVVYAFVAPGPSGGRVRIEISVIEIEVDGQRKLLPGAHVESDNDGLVADYSIVMEEDDFMCLVEIKKKDQ